MAKGQRAWLTRRVLALLILIVALAPGTWLRDVPMRRNDVLNLRFASVSLPPKAEIVDLLGPFKLENVWRLVSGHSDFGGYC